MFDAAGVSYRLPPGLVEEPDQGLPYRWWSDEARPAAHLWVGFNRSPQYWITLRRVPALGMHEMSECVDSVGGREVLVQAWRTAGGIFRDRRRADRYDVFALVPVEPGLTLYLTGGGPDRGFQMMLLAVVRTVQVSQR